MPLSWTNITPAVARYPYCVATCFIRGNGTLLESTTGESSLVKLGSGHELPIFVSGEACHDPVDKIPGDIGVDACVFGWNGSAKRPGNDCSQ